VEGLPDEGRELIRARTLELQEGTPAVVEVRLRCCRERRKATTMKVRAGIDRGRRKGAGRSYKVRRCPEEDKRYTGSAALPRKTASPEGLGSMSQLSHAFGPEERHESASGRGLRDGVSGSFIFKFPVVSNQTCSWITRETRWSQH